MNVKLNLYGIAKLGILYIVRSPPGSPRCHSDTLGLEFKKRVYLNSNRGSAAMELFNLAYATMHLKVI